MMATTPSPSPTSGRSTPGRFEVAQAIPIGRPTPSTVAERKMARMRWVDHWVGAPLCFVLGLCVTLLRQLGWRRSRSISGRQALAVFKFFGLGSILQATPLLRALRKRYPDARLLFVTFEENARLVRKLGVCSDVRTIRTHSPFLFVCDVLHEAVWLHRQGVEAAIDLEFFSKFSTLLAFFSRARVRTGFHLNDFWRYSLVTHPIYFNYYRHITDVYRQAAQLLDAEVADTGLSRFDPGDEARREAKDFLCKHGWSSGEPLLGVNINAGVMCAERRWPQEHFVEVLEALTARHANLWIVLTGAPAEQEYVQSLMERLSTAARTRTVLAAGAWSLDEFVAALECFDVFLTTDSGPMHLAASVEVPMVSLWGPGRPAFYAPRYDQHRAIYSDYACSPCLYMFTTFEGMWCNRQGWCMQAIAPETVSRAVEELLVQHVDNTASAG